jgi:hypothetical protein
MFLPVVNILNKGSARHPVVDGILGQTGQLGQSADEYPGYGLIDRLDYRFGAARLVQQPLGGFELKQCRPVLGFSEVEQGAHVSIRRNSSTHTHGLTAQEPGPLMDSQSDWYENTGDRA